MKTNNQKEDTGMVSSAERVRDLKRIKSGILILIYQL